MDEKPCDYEWRSVVAFVQYVEVNAKLIQIPGHRISSLSLKKGVKHELRRKNGALLMLLQNREKLVSWSVEQKNLDALSPGSLVMLRGWLAQINWNLETVKITIGQLETLLSHADDPDRLTQMSLNTKEVEENDTYF